MTDKTAQQVIGEHMRKIAHRVMDVFENADEDTTADEIMPQVFAAIGLVQAFGAGVEHGSQTTERGEL